LRTVCANGSALDLPNWSWRYNTLAVKHHENPLIFFGTFGRQNK